MFKKYNKYEEFKEVLLTIKMEEFLTRAISAKTEISLEMFEIIKEKLKDTDEEVIKNAVIALYNLKGKEALFEILKDETLPIAAKDEADEIYREYEDERQETDE